MARSNGPGSLQAARPAARPATRQHPSERQPTSYPDEHGYATDPRYQDQQAYPGSAEAYDPRYAQPAQGHNPAAYADWNEHAQPPRDPAPYPPQDPQHAGRQSRREPGFEPGFAQPEPAPRGPAPDQYAPRFDPYLPAHTEPSAYPAGHDPYAAPRAPQGGHQQGYPTPADFGQDAYDPHVHEQQAQDYQAQDYNEPALRSAAYDDLSPTAPPARHEARYERGPDTAGHYGDIAYQGGYESDQANDHARPASNQRPADYAGYGEPEFVQGRNQDFNQAHVHGHSQGHAGDFAQPQSHELGEVQYAGADYRQQGYAEPGFARTEAYASGSDIPAQGGPQGQYLEQVYDDEYEVEEDYEDEEEPRRSGRMFLIAGALIGAIAVGGGLAYGYKILLGPAGQADGKPPIVTSGAQPTKVRPEEPGGRQFSHTDSKIMDRLDTNRSTSSGTNPDGTRRVNTIVIGRDGALRPPASAPTPSGNAPINPVVSVPGLTVVDAFAGARAQAARQPAPATGPIVVSPPSAPAQPVVITNAAPTPPKAPPAVKTAPRAPTQTAAIPPKAPAAPRKTAAKTSPASTSSGGNGYVAVLASVPVSGSSQMDSLKTFADIQQRYPSVLANKTPEVREANLGAKGRYHRLLVGPPASRAQANEVCSELKSAGYSSCWITSF